MPRTRKTVDQERVTLAEGEAQALELKIKGWSYERIARKQGTSTSTAYRRVQNALADVTIAPATELKELEDRRLEALVEALWPVALEPGEHQIGAVRELRKLSESRRKLHGLDAPTRRALEVFAHDDWATLIGRLEAELAQNDPAAA
jgi:predicted DNA-binding protein (UPF0251 family)